MTTTTLIIGIDGSRASKRALAHGQRLSKLIGECTLLLVYVIEWSPYSFQNAAENEIRHNRREEEIEVARTRVLDPIIRSLRAEGFDADCKVRHGDAAEILNAVALETRAEQIIVARGSEGGFASRFFGTVSVKLASSASVPVTIVS
ncbi:universal stress protein [Fulvimarina sp. 2208YS6-2-32]|uniref:Universal stress protein n=1 Tax=Fulvimarina uroteuthidis TaxID=3098149 RepID=A0ABU5HXP7_9HYPH|nr:universal stress protein [Fulvimarina sp. 2208YS6-2-32]MDY8107912.1 universal stress protein [Fulvimarina sp. 2208YS6-2-32]